MSHHLSHLTATNDSSHARYWAVVPAAGVGSRMGREIPKQYLLLNSKTILEHTLKRLLEFPFLAGIVVVVSSTDSYWKTMEISHHEKIHSVKGGAERANSVLNGLNFLKDKIAAQDWVFVHDAARPCVTLSSIQKLCDELSLSDIGGILAVPVSDTLKKVDAENSILATVERNPLWQAQTPQLFRYELLRDCLQRAITQQDVITDEASAVELCGFTPKVVEGRNDNIKITRPDDLLMAEFILHNQHKQER